MHALWELAARLVDALAPRKGATKPSKPCFNCLIGAPFVNYVTQSLKVSAGLPCRVFENLSLLNTKFGSFWALASAQPRELVSTPIVAWTLGRVSFFGTFSWSKIKNKHVVKLAICGFKSRHTLKKLVQTFYTFNTLGHVSLKNSVSVVNKNNTSMSQRNDRFEFIKSGVIRELSSGEFYSSTLHCSVSK